jgi:hypothetical protein
MFPFRFRIAACANASHAVSSRFRNALLLGVASLVAFSASSSAAETWAERLGYPPRHKVIVLHAHDLGMCYETTAAGTKLLASGAIRSATAMAPCPWFGEAARWCAEHPQVDVGLDLTLNSEWENYRWRPVASDVLVASLMDPDRYLWRSITQTMVNASVEDVEHELTAQIVYAKSCGLRPTHLTTHLGALVTRPDLIEVYLRVARQHWIPAMVVEVTPEQLDRFRAQGFPLPDDLVQLFRDYPLPKVDDLRFVAAGVSYEAKKLAFLALIRDLPAGLTQVAFHPAIESMALQRIVPEWQQRVWELELLSDPEVQTALKADGIVLTDWVEIMRRFEGRPPDDARETPSEATPAQ